MSRASLPAAATSSTSARTGVAESKAAQRLLRGARRRRRGDRRTSDDLVGYVHSYEVGSTVDGPGMRFVGFLTGCLLRCQYCHNPDTWHKHNGQPVTVVARDAARSASTRRCSRSAGRHHAVRRRADDAAAVRDADLPPLQGAGLHTCIDTSAGSATASPTRS